MSDDTKSKIAALERELYSKDFKPQKMEDVLRPKESPEVNSSWDTVADDTPSLKNPMVYTEKRNVFAKKFALASGGFFIVAAVITGAVILGGSNIISGENITIETKAPLAVSGGEPFETKFVVTNGNKVSVEKATLFLEYPVGFYSTTDKTPLPRASKDLGVILAGQSITESVSALLYGEENSQKEVRVTLEYQMAGSNATIKKQTTYAIKISSSPVILKLDAPKEVSSGQEIEFTVNIDSNTPRTLGNMILSAEYPAGFTFRSAEPAPTYSTNVWLLGAFSAQTKRVVKIRGVLEGQETEQKVIRMSVGTQDVTDDRTLGVVYNTALETLSIKKPALGIDVVIDGDHSTEHAIAFGKGARVEIFWQNNNPTKVTDAVIEVKLLGPALNRYSVSPSGGGFYRSSDDTIVWEKTGNTDLATVDTGAKGSVSFNFSPISFGVDAVRMIKNPQITLEIKAHARRASQANGNEDVTTFATRNVKVDTDLRLSSQALYFSGPFKNTGPLPPKADTRTTYTIKWSVRDSSNSVSGVLVKATLPQYVTWKGSVSPIGEDVSFSKVNSEIVWNVGRIASGGAREVAFQVSLLPSLSQLGTSPVIVGDSVLGATDDFTKTILGDHRPSLNTYLSADPSFGQNQGSVVQ
jgi:hypothetical protein